MYTTSTNRSSPWRREVASWFVPKANRKNTRKQPEVKKLFTALNPDDVLVVAEWERVTRCYVDGLQIVAEVGERQAMIKELDRHCFDLNSAMGKAYLGLMSAMA